MISENVEMFWQDFCSAAGDVNAEKPYQIWHFGNTPEMAKELGELVLAGKKIATASLAAVNEIKPEDAPIPDGYSVVTDFQGEPMCVIQTTEIRHVPFNDVDAQFAFDEGEGDQTYEYWRDVHWSYFTREAGEIGIDFNERSIVCCERFRLMYPR